MTLEEKRTAIAEHCGWQMIHVQNRACYPENALCGKHKDRDPVPFSGGYAFVPFYLDDLNAMHEAEKHLGSINNIASYADELDKVCVPTHICPLTHWQATVMATASQRAEAFLKAIGKWKD